MISMKNTIRSYSGKRGCMCGCQGSYNEGDRARKLALTELTKNPDTKLEVWQADNDTTDAGCLHITTDTRIRALYLNRKGVEEALAMGYVAVEFH